MAENNISFESLMNSIKEINTKMVRNVILKKCLKGCLSGAKNGFRKSKNN